MKKASSDAGFFMGGGEEENRTPDLVIANDALSQLSYGPVSGYPASRVFWERVC